MASKEQLEIHQVIQLQVQIMVHEIMKQTRSYLTNTVLIKCSIITTIYY